MYIFLSFILAFSLIFSIPVYANSGGSTQESDSDSHSRSGSFSLGDVVHNRHGVGSKGGGFQHFVGYEGDDFNAQNFLNQPVMTVLSSVASIAPKDNLVQQIVIDLLQNEDFLNAIIFDPYNKLMSWNDVAGRHAGDTIRKYIESSGTVYVDKWLEIEKDVKHTQSNGATFTVEVYNDTTDKAYVCAIPNGNQTHLIFGAFYKGYFTATGGGPTGYYGQLSSRSGYSKAIYVSDNWTSGNLMPADGGFVDGKKIGVYSSFSEACKGLAGGIASAEPVPNGDGYLRPLPPNRTIYSTSNNIYNTNWTDIIHNNYTTYGDNFENTVLNTYYYTVPSNSTPVYFYDIYDNDNITISPHEYDDISNINLGEPSISTDNTFLVNLFNSLPVAISTLIVSLLILSVVILFLKG